MKLKELVQQVDNILESFKAKQVQQIAPSQYFFTEDDARYAYTKLGGLDDEEIQNITQTYWDVGITSRNYMEVERAVGYCLLANCKTLEEQQQKLEWLKNINENTCIPICRRIHRRKPPVKANDHEWRFGTFNKFDFITAYGYMYDSDDEASKDANDTSSICPLLVGLLQSGWLDFVVAEDKNAGKVTVSQHIGDIGCGCSSFLGGIISSVETIIENTLMKIKIAVSKFDMAVIKYNPTFGGKPDYFLTNDESKYEEYVLGLSCFLTDETKFPQDVYDFHSVNQDFLEVVNNAFQIILTLNETQHDLARDLYVNVLDNMRKLADFECEIVRQQHKLDPITNRFIKPEFNPNNLIYCAVLADILNVLEAKYGRVMRMPTSVRQRDYPLVAGLDSRTKIYEYCKKKTTVL